MPTEAPQVTVEDLRTPARVPDEWYDGFHRGLAARFWRAAGATMADDDADLAAELLALPPGGRVLDAPCGDGRLTIRLARRGYDAVGVDLAPEEVEHARAEAAAAGVRAAFVRGDLRSLPDVGTVDGVLSWGNAFGYVLPEESAASLAGFRRVLRPGGRLVLETHTVAESLLMRGFEEDTAWTFGGITMHAVQQYRAEESRLEADFRFEDADGIVEHSRAAHHVHTTGEVVRMLRAGGFADVELRGPDGRERYVAGDARLIVVATA